MADDYSVPGIQTGSLQIALFTGFGCLAAQGALQYLFARALPDGFWRRKPALVAHQLIALPLMFLVAAIGCRAWFSSARETGTPESRIYSREPASETLAAILLGELVLWDIPFTLVPSLYSHASMGHHVGLAALAALSLTPFLQYYVPFFAGVIEISSIPLQVVDFFHPKNFADLLPNSQTLTTLNTTARILFIVSFIALRTLWFPAVIGFQVIPDLVALMPRVSEANAIWLYVGIGFAVSFTLLQLYWSVLLCKQVRKALQGRDDEHSLPPKEEPATPADEEFLTPFVQAGER